MSDKEKKQNKVFLRTFGCQMNEYDTELIRAILLKDGFVFTDNELDADVILLNTCSVREKANRTIFGLIHKIRHDRQGRPAIYGILGCMATDLKENLINDRHLNIDLIAGPDSYRRLPELVNKCLKQPRRDAQPCVSTKKHNAPEIKPCDISLSESETYEDIYPIRENSVNAWIAIMRGCNNFCSYCVVPYTRGRERSRSPKSILDETNRLADEGFPQVTLLGQNVNSYHYRNMNFPELLEQVCSVEKIKRVWFTSPHPKDAADKLIDVLAENPKVCKHIHLPLQAGNNDILKKMNRPYTKEHYLRLVDKLRAKCPDIAITTDIIVGFPTETDAQFQDTVDVFNYVGYDSAFIFKYSPRPVTKAAKDFKDDVPEEVKTKRIVFLNQMQQHYALMRNQALIGTTQEILIDTIRDTETEGRTIHNKRVVLSSVPACQNLQSKKSSHLLGSVMNISIIDATPHLLQGNFLPD